MSDIKLKPDTEWVFAVGNETFDGSLHARPKFELVRCKHCKHWDQTDNLPEHYGECLDSVFEYCVPREDFFCKNGERRSE